MSLVQVELELVKETPIMRAQRLALTETGHWRGWRCSSGFDPRANVLYGLGKGAPDLVGVLWGGRMCCFETKTPKGRLSKRQRAWHGAAREWGIFVAVARSVPEALEALGRALAGGLE